MVAEDGGRIVCFMVYQYLDHFRLINLAVHPDYRGQGIARQMVDALRRKLSDQRPRIVVLMPEPLKTLNASASTSACL